LPMYEVNFFFYMFNSANVQYNEYFAVKMVHVCRKNQIIFHEQ